MAKFGFKKFISPYDPILSMHPVSFQWSFSKLLLLYEGGIVSYYRCCFHYQGHIAPLAIFVYTIVYTTAVIVILEALDSQGLLTCFGTNVRPVPEKPPIFISLRKNSVIRKYVSPDLLIWDSWMILEYVIPCELSIFCESWLKP